MRLCQNNSKIKKKILNVIVPIIKTKELLILESYLSFWTVPIAFWLICNALWKPVFHALGLSCGRHCGCLPNSVEAESSGMVATLWKKVRVVPSWSVPDRTADVTSLCSEDVFCQLAVPRYVEGSRILIPHRARLPLPRVSTYDLRKVSFNQEKDFFF